MAALIREGAFVLTNFPPNRPDVPGPKPYIAYCLGYQNTSRGPVLMLAYTSSGPWRPPGSTLPLGVIQFDREAARALNQVPFHLDLRVLARVPESPAWLPRLNAPDHGIISWADRVLRDRITDLATQTARHRSEVIAIRGPTR